MRSVGYGCDGGAVRRASSPRGTDDGGEVDGVETCPPRIVWLQYSGLPVVPIWLVLFD